MKRKLNLVHIEKIKDGKFIKNYKLTFKNQLGNTKDYEMISFNDLKSYKDIGSKTNGVAIIAFYHGKLLLLREFRMAVNDYVYNLVAGQINKGETIKECVEREIYEETGLSVVKITHILPPAFAAAALTDLRTTFVIVEVSGEISNEYMNENEDIHAKFYTPDEVKELLSSSNFNANAQLVTLFYSLFSALIN